MNKENKEALGDLMGNRIDLKHKISGLQSEVMGIEYDVSKILMADPVGAGLLTVNWSRLERFLGEGA